MIVHYIFIIDCLTSNSTRSKIFKLSQFLFAVICEKKMIFEHMYFFKVVQTVYSVRENIVCIKKIIHYLINCK